jgi:hypothetical protein
MNRDQALLLGAYSKAPDDRPSQAKTLPLPTSSRAAGADPPAAAALAALDRVSQLVDREISQTQTAPLPLPRSTKSAAESQEEEPLEAYLEQLMQRLINNRAQTTKEYSPAAPARTPSGPAPSAPPAEPAPPREPTRPPECREQLSAMREVANQSARVAVDQHARRSLSDKSCSAFIAAAAASLLSCGLAAAAVACDLPWAGRAAALAGLAALALTYRFFALRRQLAKAAAAAPQGPT